MVDLPKGPRRLSLVQEPQSRLSGGDIAAPYKMAANALDKEGEALTKVGGALEDISVPLAEQAGYNAVTKDGNGDLQVQQMPIVGKAATAFSRAVKIRATIEGDTKADKDLLEMREEFRLKGDPEGFRQAAEKYRDERVAHYEQQGGSAVALGVRRSIESNTTQIYRGLLNEKQSLDLRRSSDAIEAKKLTLADEMESLARRKGTGTPEYAEKLQSLDALLKEQVDNPLFAYPKEKADAFRDATMTRADGAALLEQVERVYNDRGHDAAREYLKGSVRELGGKLKAADKIEKAGMAWLRSEEAQWRGERDSMSREWSVAKPQYQTLSRSALQDMADRAGAIGAHRVSADIEAHMLSLDHVATIKALPVSEQARVVLREVLPPNLTPTQHAAKSMIEAEAQRQGVPPELAVAVGWRESKLDPGARPSTSSAQGVFQLTKANRDFLGVGAGAGIEIQVQAGVAHLKTTMDTLRNSLGREPTAAEVYMGHFQGAGTAAAIIRANPNEDLKAVLDRAAGPGWGDKVFKANPWMNQRTQTVGEFRAWADRVMGGGGGTDLTQSRAGLIALGSIKKDMAGNLNRRITDLRGAVAKEEFPSIDEAVELGYMVHAIGTPEQQQQVAELAAQARFGSRFAQLSPVERSAVISQMDASLREGGPKFDRQLRAVAAKADRDIDKAYKDDAYGAHYRFAEGAKPTVIDFSKPESVDQRIQEQNQMRADGKISEARSVMRPDEANVIANALTQGKPETAAALLGVMAQKLPADIYTATIADKPIKDALDGMVRSYDPARLNTAMGVLDNMRQRDPLGFDRTFGADTHKRLDKWRARKDSLTPEAMAEYFKLDDSPTMAAARKTLEEKADAELKELTPRDVAVAMGTAWSVTPGVFARNITGTEALPPADALKAEAFTNEFRNLVRDRYVDANGDMDKAKEMAAERMAVHWGASATNQGRLMKHPPERHYPAVNDSHDWMARDVEAEIERITGKTQNVGDISPERQWTYELLATPETEADIAAKQTPRYKVMVRPTAGKPFILIDPATGRDFIRWNSADAQTKAREEFSARRSHTQAIGEAGASGLSAIGAVP